MRKLLLVLLTALIGGLVGAGTGAAAHAADPVTSTTLLRTSVPLDRVQYKLTTLTGLAMTAGQKYLISGRWAATSPVRVRPTLQGAQLHCVNAAGQGTVSAWTTRNHTGGTSASRVVVRWLFTAPVTGTYECMLRGHADSSDADAGQYLTVLGGGETFVSADRVPDVDGDEWRQPQLEINSGAAAYVLRKNYPAATGTKALILADVELTNNYDRGVYGRNSTVQVRLEVVQVNTAGQVCGAPVHLYEVTRSISSQVHHDKIYTAVTAPKSGLAACANYFAVKVYVRVASGNPVTVEGANYTNAIGRTR